MRVLVLGATGILGRALVAEGLARGLELTATYHRRLPSGPGLERLRLVRVDLAQPARVVALLEGVSPDVVINAAGVTRARCSDDPAAAWTINALSTHVLADAARSVGARLVHVSSDCVFRGDRGPYPEDALPDAIDLYGRSKARGEVRHTGFLTVRTSFVGHEVGTSHGLLAWLLAQRRPVPGYTNHLWSGVTAPFLARTLLDLATRTDVRVTGVLHVHGEDTSKARLLRVLSRAFRRDVPVLDVEAVEPVDRRLRSALLADLGVQVPPLEELARELAATAQRRGARS